MLSLRRRLLVGTALGMAVILSVAGVTVYVVMRASLLAEFDRSLSEKAKTLASLIEQGDGKVELEFTEAEMAEFERADRPEYFQVWIADGTIVRRSPSLQGHDLAQADGSLDIPAIHPRRLPDGSPGRVATLRFVARLDDEAAPDESPYCLVLGLGRDVLEVQAALAGLRWTLIVVGALAIMVSVGVLAWLVRVGLRPADRLALQIGGLDERRLSERIDSTAVPRELRPVACRLNELLDRLDAAFTREKTMTADVAHELRTPLAGLRSTLEVALSRPRDREAYRQTMSDCLTICTQTQTLVENLLALARLDAGREAVRPERTDIEELLRSAWQPFHGAANDKGLSVNWEVEKGLTAETDPDKLRLVLGNVFENAVHYANTGGAMTVRAGRANGTLRISVSNTGSRVSTEQVARVFDRFWRGDSARQSDGVYSGLGLSLCKTMIERLGGAITADSAEGGTFSVVLTLL